ncbi:MAG: UDP-N-acetylmuramate dehydrogenase [Candidatus Nealsonbacteria bacterium]|nr:UDP-N-acetylmuramate dehydrogenase [Candidatus Nealsonbacteria bacterium]
MPGIRENVFLAKYTSFRIGGPAKYFFEAKTKKEIIKAVKWAKENNLPFFILGGGSNLLVSDEGYSGLVIKLQTTNHKLQTNKIYTDAGVPLSLLISESVKNNLTGLEWAAGIPGQVGGAIRGNAGAFGKSMADIIKSVEVLMVTDRKMQNAKCKMQNDKLKFKIKKFSNRECKFRYRDSLFRKYPDLIILSAELSLKKGKKTEIKKKIKEYLNYRKETQPLNFPSAGSVFKNPPGFSAGKLIEKCGLKGKKIREVKISEKHANFIVNLGKGKAKDVKELINLAKKSVKKKFGIVLEEEIQYLP